jgi:hypothetical protein
MEQERSISSFGEKLGPELGTALFIGDRCDRYHLDFSDREILEITNVSKIKDLQKFLTHSEYRYSTCYGPKNVLRTGSAHCFEAACFAHTVLFLNGIQSYVVLQEFTSEQDHNVVIYQHPKTKLWGYVDSLKGEFAQYHSWQALMRASSRKKPRIIGFSEPIDLVNKFGTKWMTQDELWDLYYLYIDRNVRFFPTKSYGKIHRYQTIEALQNGWIQIVDGEPMVIPSCFPEAAQEILRKSKFFSSPSTYRKNPTLERKFLEITGGTPRDFLNQSYDLRDFLQRGFTVDQIADVPHAETDRE